MGLEGQVEKGTVFKAGGIASAKTWGWDAHGMCEDGQSTTKGLPCRGTGISKVSSSQVNFLVCLHLQEFSEVVRQTCHLTKRKQAGLPRRVLSLPTSWPTGQGFPQ